MLTTRTLQTTLKEILSSARKAIDYIQSRFLNHHIKNCVCVWRIRLLSQAVLWLSKGQALVLILITEVSFFFFLKRKKTLKHFEREDFIYGLAYLKGYEGVQILC